MDTLLVVGRFCHYLAAMILFGSSATAGYLTWSLPLASREQVMSRLQTVHRAAALSAMASAMVWLFAVAGGMGEGWVDAFDPVFVGKVLSNTSFGVVWLWRLVAGVTLVLLTIVGRRGGTLLALLSGLSLLSIALTGHAAMEDGTRALVYGSSDGIHLLAGAIWIGGLVTLALALSTPEGGGAAIRRFSLLGYWAVLAVMLSGVVNAWFLVGSPQYLITTTYGRLLAIKLILVASMVGVAMLNRFRFAPRLARDPDRIGHLLRTTVRIELVLALLVLLLVAVFGTLAPPA
ncbi:conserved membrane hypothetical protein [Mesorhizobium metallidurans STM 2683]|uniref:Copper resistance protein D domain-containing protein n=1 Tax=Mesorhizobium metallidurans STM 2683 TaxID=1297569 RepID=M5ETT7_9HYPH|nr:copper homeostasis membrane protein CopD [Mesorhizobium metallidurans]CCV08379.1 conserved membrane hypothetical protein [Mesorhizobium metallidurans STM 2683]